MIKRCKNCDKEFQGLLSSKYCCLECRKNGFINKAYICKKHGAVEKKDIRIYINNERMAKTCSLCARLKDKKRHAGPKIRKCRECKGDINLRFKYYCSSECAIKNAKKRTFSCKKHLGVKESEIGIYIKPNKGGYGTASLFCNICKTENSKKQEACQQRKHYRQSNKELVNKRNREYRRKHKDLIAQYYKEYRENNKEYLKIGERRRLRVAIEQLSDGYIKGVLRRRGIDDREINFPVIELKRLHLMLMRKLKETKDEKC